jgi:colicin import membrane protein
MREAPKLLLASACALGLAFASPAVRGQAEPRPAGGVTKEAVKKAAEARKDAKEAQAEAKDARKEAKEAKGEAKEAKEEAKEAKGEAKEANKEALEALKEKWAKLRETRKERKQASREEVKKLWGDLALKPAVKNELRNHAWRMARLKRIRAVAEAEGKTELVKRCDTLIEKEKDRHQKRMEDLKAKGGAE